MRSITTTQNSKHLFDRIVYSTAYYCLSFDYKFEHCDDEVLFAYTIPYSYTQMQ